MTRRLKNPSASNAFIDLTGRKVGHWTVLGKGGRNKHGELLWWCVCSCGTQREVKGQYLRIGDSKSCGCQTNVSHGHARRDASQAMYRRWQAMLHRCHMPKHKEFHRYGGRGIVVCDRWRFGEGGKHGFECYLADLGEPPFDGASVDRINNDGSYEPNNVRWATQKQQMRNSRRAALHEYRGRLLCITELAEMASISARTLGERLSKGWPVELAVHYPANSGRTPLETLLRQSGAA